MGVCSSKPKEYQEPNFHNIHGGKSPHRESLANAASHHHGRTGSSSGGICPMAAAIAHASGPQNGSSTFLSTFDPNVKVSLQTVFEHYQPYEFPIVPIINSHTQSLVRASFKKILDTEYDSEDTVSGKMSGATYFYNQFFKQLFLRLRDFERIFPDIKSRAEIISKVMAMVLSIRVEELELAKARLKSLGSKHVHIVQDPWLFGVYVTTIHSTVRLCLGDEANEDVMSAWLHLLAWVLRNMLAEYLERLQFSRYFDGATNSASAVTAKHREEIKVVAEVVQLRSAMRSSSAKNSNQASKGASEVSSRRHSPPRRNHSPPMDREEAQPASSRVDASTKQQRHSLSDMPLPSDSPVARPSTATVTPTPIPRVAESEHEGLLNQENDYQLPPTVKRDYPASPARSSLQNLAASVASTIAITSSSPTMKPSGSSSVAPAPTVRRSKLHVRQTGESGAPNAANGSDLETP